MDILDRFAVLREALAQDRWGEAEITTLVDRSCELQLTAGQVLIEVGDPSSEWFVVVSGRLEVREATGRRWLAVAGMVLHPDESGAWTLRAVPLEPCTVLAITAVDPIGSS